MKSLTKLTLTACLYAPLAWSQCSGVSTGGACVPPPCSPGSPLACNQQRPQGQQQAAQQPQAVWADRWGAIALDPAGKGQGTVTGYVSRSAAIDAAMEQCTAQGAPNCELRRAYKNACAAVAWNPHNLATAGAVTESSAKSDALKACGESSCQIVYSACSMAERVR
jgi:hypothetical protein